MEKEAEEHLLDRRSDQARAYMPTKAGASTEAITKSRPPPQLGPVGTKMRKVLNFVLGRPLTLAVKACLLVFTMQHLTAAYFAWGIVGVLVMVIGIVTDVTLMIYDVFELLLIVYKHARPRVERALQRFENTLDRAQTWMVCVYGREPRVPDPE